MPSNADSYGQRHIVRAKSSSNTRNILARNKVIANFADVISGVRLVEVSDNQKILSGNSKAQKRKNKVEKFYRLFAPVKLNNKLFTLLITAEDFDGNVGFEPKEVNLYEIETKKIKAVRTSTELNSTAYNDFSKISIREVLRNVKDVNGVPYINADDTGNYVALNQSAWHGTPHEFSKFDLGSIGTGEGAQAHGWGLYFAKDKKIAEGYRDRLSDNIITYNGKDINELYKNLLSKNDYGKASVIEEVVANGIAELRQNKDALIEDEIITQKDYDWFESKIAPKTKRSGMVFEVDVPETDVLLDEDSSFNEQPKKVQEALRSLFNKEIESEDDFAYSVDYKDLRATVGFYTEAALDFETEYLYDDLINDIETLAGDVCNGRDTIETEQKIRDELTEQLSVWVEEQGRDGRDIDFAINNAINDIKKTLEDSLKKYQSKDLLFKLTGEQIYDEIIKMVGTPKEASLLLNEYGIKGITYDGAIDGRCFVVFDDKAISIINRFNQAAGLRAETSNAQELQKAIRMNDDGESAETIYDKTGWYLGADGKWRFDIPDNLDKIDLSEIPKEGHYVRLEELYDNPALYKAYPWLKDVSVIVEEQKHSNGSANSQLNLIKINPSLVKKGNRDIVIIGKKNFFRTQMDGKFSEWQEADGEDLTEAERKAFEVISENEMKIDKAIAFAEESINYYENAAEKTTRPPYAEYCREEAKKGKVVSSILKAMKDKGFDYFKLPYKDAEKTRELFGSTLIHEIQHLIQGKEGFASGGNPARVLKQIQEQVRAYEFEAREISTYATSYYNAYKAKEDAFIMGNDKDVAKWDEKVKKYERLIKKEDREKIIDLYRKANRLLNQHNDYRISELVKYHNLHGEQEARAASEKAEMNTEIERLEAEEVRSFNEILDAYIGEVQKGNRNKILDWVDQYNVWTDKNASREKTIEAKTKMDEIQEVVKSDKKALEFFKAVEKNDDLSFNKEWNLDFFKDRYKEKVLKSVNPFSAIIVFDGEVSSEIDTSPKGRTTVMGKGKKLVELFKNADESTFIHEVGHLAYEDLKEQASMQNAPQQIKQDLKTVDDWASWKEGQIEEYKGTAVYDEFAQRDAAIRKAVKEGDTATAEMLKYEWKQERFGRGFEEYLRQGTAPSNALKKVFQKFKEWLSEIYQGYKAIGAVPSKEVQAVMDRLILSKKETTQSQTTKKFSLVDSEEYIETREELIDEIVDVFGDDVQHEIRNDGILVTTPNGKRILVKIKDEIILNEEDLARGKREHGYAEDEEVQVGGYWQRLAKGDFDGEMVLSVKSPKGITYHETLHAVMDLALTAKEKAALLRSAAKEAKETGIDIEEVIAERYRKWVLARKRGEGTAFGKLFQKMKDMYYKLKALFTRIENAHNVMRKIESGEVWERDTTPLYKKEAAPKFMVSEDRVSKFVNAVLRNPKAKLTLALGKVSEVEAQAIKEATGYDVAGYEHVWKSNDVKHIEKRHGEGNEKTEGQQGLTKKEIASAVRIIEAPTKIEKGSPNNGKPSIRFIKSADDGTYTVVEVVRDFNKTLIIKTMWKNVADKHHGNNALLDTSETAISNQSSTVGDSLSQGKGEVKYSLISSKNKFKDAVVTTKPKSLAKTIKEQGWKGWIKELWKNFYRNWVDKNDSLHALDDIISMALGRPLKDDEKVYNKAQMMNATAAGKANALIEGSDEHIEAISKRIGKPLHKVTLAKILSYINKL